MTDKDINKALVIAQRRCGTNITSMMKPDIFLDFCKTHQVVPTYTSTDECICSLLNKTHRRYSIHDGSELCPSCKNPVPTNHEQLWDHDMFFKKPNTRKIDCIVLQPYWQPNHAAVMPEVISWAEAKGLTCIWNEGPGVSWWNNGVEGETEPHLGQCVRIEFWRQGENYAIKNIAE